MNLGVQLLPPAEVGQEKGHDNPCRFLPACCFRCQRRPALRLWPWSESKTGRLERDSILPGRYDLPGKFPIFREDSQFKPYLQGFRYADDMETIGEGRIVASY